MITARAKGLNAGILRWMPASLVLCLALLASQCATSPKASERALSPRVWTSNAGEIGNPNAPEVPGFLSGEAVLVCLRYGALEGKMGTTTIRDAVTGAVVFDRTDPMKEGMIAFYNVPDLPRGGYTVTVSFEGAIRMRSKFFVN